jgi:hypothetical protein
MDRGASPEPPRGALLSSQATEVEALLRVARINLDLAAADGVFHVGIQCPYPGCGYVTDSATR